MTKPGAGSRRERHAGRHQGLVVGVSGPRFWVKVEGREVGCLLRGRLKRERRPVTSLVVVGDAVEVTLLPDGGGAIESVEPRRSELARPGFAGRTRVAAANLDQLVAVTSTHKPEFNRRIAERYLALALRGRMQGLVVINKCDLEDEAVVLSWARPLREVGVRVILTVAKTGFGVEELRQALAGRLSAMVGLSGVGKSSLVNAIDPALRARIGDLSELRQRGKHTTTASRLYPLPGGGLLADTPGIRELALFEGDEELIASVFPEIEAAAVECRFRSCTHSHEPDCAVKAAVERGEIDRDRLASFLKLRQDQ